MANMQPKKEIVDVVVIGCGAGGGVIAKELSEAGLSSCSFRIRQTF